MTLVTAIAQFVGYVYLVLVLLAVAAFVILLVDSHFQQRAMTRRIVASLTELDADDRDIVPEGLGLPLHYVWVRVPDRERELHHPLGHRTAPLTSLPEEEWQLWTEIVAKVAHQ